MEIQGHPQFFSNTSRSQTILRQKKNKEAKNELLWCYFCKGFKIPSHTASYTNATNDSSAQDLMTFSCLSLSLSL